MKIKLQVRNIEL